MTPKYLPLIPSLFFIFLNPIFQEINWNRILLGGTSEQVFSAFSNTPVRFMGITAYDPSSQDSGTFQVIDAGQTLRLDSNAWKKVVIDYDISTETVLRFDIRITGLGEIHGIRFDNDNTLGSGNDGRTFQVAGTQNYGNTDFKTYNGNDWQTYTIPVGSYFTGTFQNLVFVADKDSNGITQESFFRNVVISEPSIVPVMATTTDTDGDGVIDIDDLDDDNDGIHDGYEICNYSHDFGSLSTGNYMRESPQVGTDAGLVFTGQEARWTGTGNNRSYIRTIKEDFFTTSGIFEVTAYIPGNNSSSAPFVGLGSGIPGSFFEEPEYPLLGISYRTSAQQARVYDRVPGDPGFFDASIYPNGSVTNPANSPIRFRITWDATTKTAIMQVDGQYNGTFSSDYSHTVNGADNGFTNQNLRFYFGGGDGVRFDDVLVTSACYNDSDSIEPILDLDSDNDGIYDAVEAGHGSSQNNGRVTGPVGTNGLADILETSPDSGIPNYTLSNTDGDDRCDYQDLDSDGDSCNDVDEAYGPGLDSDNDGIYGNGTPTVNAQGVIGLASYTIPADRNGNSIYDFREASAAPTISQQPRNQYAVVGGNAVFTVIGSANGFQWQASTNSSPFNDIPGAVNSTLTLTNVNTAMNGNRYRVIVKNAGNVCQNLTSAYGTLLIDRDSDLDGIMDNADLDDDDDGIPDSLEKCIFTENFNDGTLDSALEESDSNRTPAVVIDYGSGNASFSHPTNDGRTRRYIRSVDNGFYNKSVMFEVTAIVPSSNAPAGTPFVGLGPGVASTAYFGEPEHPKIGSNIRLDLDNLYYHDKMLGDTFPTADRDRPGDVSNTQVRFRMTWNADTKMALIEVDTGYNGSTFITDYSRVFNGADNGFTDSNMHVYFGGGSRIVFDDFIMVVDCDDDLDGIHNALDLDSDNDGIFDAIEAGHNVPHINGRVDGNVGLNGLSDAVETTTDSNTINYTLANSDSVGTIDFLSQDSDADTCNDTLEAGFLDDDADGYLGSSPVSVDINGLVTAQGGYLEPNDHDSNGIFDFREVGSIPQFIQQPESNVSEVGGTVVFEAITNANVHQWQVSTDGGSLYTNLLGENGASLSLSNLQLDQNGNIYRLIISNNSFACGDRFSFPVLLTVAGDNDTDGINDLVDLDDDNDGIPDNNELASNITTISLTGDFTGSQMGGHPLIATGSNAGRRGTDGGTYDIQLSSQALVSLGSNDILEKCSLNVRIGRFDDGLRVDIDGVTILNFNQTHWRYDNDFQLAGKFNSDGNTSGAFGWEPWKGEGNMELVITKNDIQLLVDTGTGTRENALPYMLTHLGSGNNKFIYNPVDFDCASGVDFDIFNANQATATRLQDVTLNAVATILNDTDMDGVADKFDLDSDNDGIFDAVEAGHEVPQINGMVNGAVGANGLLDTVETSLDSGAIVYSIADSDMDSVFDFQSLDSDADTCVDTIEAGFTDDDLDGYLGIAPMTVDSKGLISGQGGFSEPSDGDANGTYDFREFGEIPVIAEQPLDLTVCKTNDVMFEVGTSTPQNYQWQVWNGSDWTDLSDTGIYSGATTATLQLTGVSVNNDGSQYRAIVTGTAFACGQIVSDVAELTVESFDPNIIIGDASATEGNTIDFGVALSEAKCEPLTLTFQLVDGTADDRDYTNTNITLTIPAGETTAVVSVPTTDDTVFEPDETFTIEIESINSGTAGDNTDTAVGTIVNDDEVIDLDSDNDGILNNIEDLDLDADGNPSSNPTDSDGDGFPDYLDIDSDQDGIPDNLEAQTTQGYIPPSGLDANGNGLDDAYETNGEVGLFPIDTDSDSLPDYLDEDSDADGVPDATEGNDFNSDGISDIATIGSDKDDDGLDDGFEASVMVDMDVNDELDNPILDLPDTDGDGESDYRDIDDDDDGILTINEDANLDRNYANDDVDGDGVPDYLDPDILSQYDNDSLKVFNIITPNGDGVYDELEIVGLDEFPDNSIRIFNRWGREVYFTQRYGSKGNTFNGESQANLTVERSKGLPTGTYFYILEYSDGVEPTRSMSGYIYLNR